MLEVRGLCKTYRSETGVEVKALENVSFSLPETGMVFFLGKSGSGKTTLFNILGGLDTATAGEFILLGKSSKDFTPAEFDAYRNTYVGFVFQEFQLLEDFNVGANLALAMELQGKKADEVRVNQVLAAVGMSDYGSRRVTELSGGQMQRVSIARALIKEPKIILADEPTGALDSETGKQIFELLRALSRERLVLVISHDRDFAKEYGDRVIELSDGRVVSDVTCKGKTSPGQGIQPIAQNVWQVANGYTLTAEDAEKINAWLAENKGDLYLSAHRYVNRRFLRAESGIWENTAKYSPAVPAAPVSDEKSAPGQEIPAVPEAGASAEHVAPTEERDEPGSRSSGPRFIRSKLPMKDAMRIALGSVLLKKVRLAMTILLAFLSLTMFAVTDTLAAFDRVNAVTDTLIDAKSRYAAVSLGIGGSSRNKGALKSTFFATTFLSDTYIALLQERAGVTAYPVFTGNAPSGASPIPIAGMEIPAGSSALADGCVYGFCALDAKGAREMGFDLTGRMPQSAGEIVITEFVYRQFLQYGFKNAHFGESVKPGQLNTRENDPDSILGKHFTVNTGDMGIMGTSPFEIVSARTEGLPTSGRERPIFDFTIVGVLDTHFEYDRFERLLSVHEGGGEEEDLWYILLRQELDEARWSGPHALCYVTMDDIDYMATFASCFRDAQQTNAFGRLEVEGLYYVFYTPEGESIRDFLGLGTEAAIAPEDIVWLDGAQHTAIGEREFAVPISVIDVYDALLDYAPIRQKAAELFGEDAWQSTGTKLSFTERINAAAPAAYAERHWQEHREILEERGGLSFDGTLAEYYTSLLLSDPRKSPFVGSPSAAEIRSVAVDEFVPVLADYFRLPFDAGTPSRCVQFVRDLLGTLSEENIDVRGRNLNEYTGAKLSKFLFRYYVMDEVVRRKMWQNEDFVSYVKRFKRYTAGQWEDMGETQQIDVAVEVYATYLENRTYRPNLYGTLSLFSLRTKYLFVILEMRGITDAAEHYRDLSLKNVYPHTEDGRFDDRDAGDTIDWQNVSIVGFYDAEKYGPALCKDALFEISMQMGEKEGYHYRHTAAIKGDTYIWTFALIAVPTKRSDVENLVRMDMDQSEIYQFNLKNHILFYIDMADLGSDWETIAIGRAAGTVLLLFAGLLFAALIGGSIAEKQRDIGALRALGARPADVYRIFFTETLFVAFINALLATPVAAVGTHLLNLWAHGQGVRISMFHFGIRQVLLIFAVSIASALLAAWVPIRRMNKHSPAEIIRGE